MQSTSLSILFIFLFVCFYLGNKHKVFFVFLDQKNNLKCFYNTVKSNPSLFQGSRFHFFIFWDELVFWCNGCLFGV